MTAANPVLFIPGMMLDARLYASQVAGIGRTHRVIVGALTGPETIEGLAIGLLASAPALFALVGLSMGGIVALEIMRRAPERVTHLALLDTTPFADAPERRTVRLEQIARVERGELREVLSTSMKPLYLASKNRLRRDLLEPILQMGIDLGPEIFRAQSLALRNRRDYRDVLDNICCPTLVLCGREDQLCPLDRHVLMAERIPKADLVVLSETGHLSALESPQSVTRMLQALLDRTS